MKKLLLTTLAISLLAGPAFAQRYDSRDRDRDGPRNEQRYEQRGDRRGGYDEGDRVPYGFMKGGKYIYYDWRNTGLQRPPRGFAWMKIGDQFLLADQKSGLITDTRAVRSTRVTWREGGMVPYEYRVGGKYIEYNWRRAGLSPPPSGYQWMRIDDAYILADQQSGRIEDVRPAWRDRR